MNRTQLAAYFSEQFYISDLKSKEKKDVLKEMVTPLVEHGLINRENILLETLYQRETLGSTGIGRGVAVPHCRTLAANDLHVIVGLSKNGIPYDSVDKKDVHLLFLIVAPPHDESNLYLPLLGKIVELVRDNKLRKKLMHVDDFETFQNLIIGG